MFTFLCSGTPIGKVAQLCYTAASPAQCGLLTASADHTTTSPLAPPAQYKENRQG